MILKLGDTVVIGQPRASDERTIRGPGWEAVQTETGYELGFIRAEHGGREQRYAITAEEFAELRADPGKFGDIVARRRD